MTRPVWYARTTSWPLRISARSSASRILIKTVPGRELRAHAPAAAVLRPGLEPAASLLNTIFASSVAGYVTAHLTPATLVQGHPAPSLAAMSLIHGYTTGFWVAAAILGAGAVICGALFRPGPLRTLAPASTDPARTEEAVLLP